MRPIVFSLFFLIFAAAALVWIMNDPQMQSWRDSPILATIAKFTSQPSTPNTKPKIQKKLDPRFVKLEQMLARQQATLDSQQAALNTLKQATPLRVESGFLLAKKSDKNWKLANLFSKKRLFEKRIDFSTPFSTPPRVIIGITTIELINEKTRLSSHATAIDNTGFSIKFETKSDARIGEVSVDWAAFGG